MKELRNKVYSKYGPYEPELGNNGDGTFCLISRNGIQPDKTFIKHPGAEGVYVKYILASDVDNAFSVTTLAEYCGQIWQADRIDNGKVRMSIGHHVDIPGLTMVDRGWYELWIDKNDIDRIWESRKKSGYDFPFPINFEEVKLLDVRLL